MRKPAVAVAVVAGSIFAGLAHAAPDPSVPSMQDAQLAQLCAKVVCRKAIRKLNLRLPDGQGFEIDTKPFPYLDDHGVVVLFPGETVGLSLSVMDGKLEPPQLQSVDDPSGPTNFAPLGAGLVFKLIQIDGKADMQLSAANSVNATIKYDAVIFVATTNGVRPQHTSICPVMAPQKNASTFTGMEMWAQPIVMMEITNIHVLLPGASMNCE